MSYIRDRREEKTGFQESCPLQDNISFGNDFVMVYGVNETTEDRIRACREAGYVVHLMVGISWGGNDRYFSGGFDGDKHEDEGQTDRFGNVIWHARGVDPYVVPTVSFADYKTEMLKKAVDLGVEAIHVEEPEFWDRGGYSEAFKREYRLYYREPWAPPHSSVDARYKAAQLKAYLFKRTIGRVASSLKEYCLKKYGRELRFYVPTHSLLNYTQWKIVSPEGKLADIAPVDGCIAQVWTGTSRERNWYDGVLAERNFETSYLEYGVMQELVRGTGRRMWFLHDPIEDISSYDWDDYSRNYLKTVTASLLHPGINDYEICPWPRRVVNNAYPIGSPDAVTIPDSYRTMLNNLFQALGDIVNEPDAQSVRVGVFMSDSELYERDYPDGLIDEKIRTDVGTVLRESPEELDEMRGMFDQKEPNVSTLLKFKRSNAFPSFYGLAMPLLKHGIGVRPVLLDNLKRYPSYLEPYDLLILSYEFMKPESPDINNVLASWVRAGGTLIYVGDGSDPYHGIRSWWTGKYPTPAEHLYEMLGVAPTGGKQSFAVGKGVFCVWDADPARFCFSSANSGEYRAFVGDAFARSGYAFTAKNYLTQTRGDYLVAACMNESVSDEPLVLEGLFADMYTTDLEIKTRVVIEPDTSRLLFDLSKIGDGPRVIGTSVRIVAMESTEDVIKLQIVGCDPLDARIRLRLPFAPAAADIDGDASLVSFDFDEPSRTVLLRFESRSRLRTLTIKKRFLETAAGA